MATTPKKRSKKSKVARTASRVESLSQLKKTIATQEKTITTQARELRQAAEQQTATSEVLRVIASSPTELQPVLDTLLANAVKLSGASKGHIRQHAGETLRYVAHYNESPELIDALNQLPQHPRPDGMGTRALVERKPIHVLDAQAEPSYRAPAAQANARTMLIVPLLREGSGIGTITIWLDIVEPFTERQIELVKTFADQAVIAIENARLSQERETRNRDLAALHDVTAAASQSLEIKPVLDEVVKKITEIFAFDSVSIYLFDPQREYLNSVASFGTQEDALHPRVFRRGQGLTGRVADTERADPF